jgi:uncharacterized protein (TIGR04255 family)
VESILTPPLQQAVIEVNFPGDPRAELARGSFFEQIREAFPLLFTPNMGSETRNPAQAPYLFRNLDQTVAVGIGINSFVYMIEGSKAYPGHDTFFRQANVLLRNFVQLASLREEMSRVVLRYVNEFPILRQPDGGIEVTPLEIDSIFTFPNHKKENLLGVGLISEYRIEDSVVRYIIDAPRSEENHLESAATLDLTHTYQGKINLLDVENRLYAAHSVLKSTMMKIIDEKYRKLVGGTDRIGKGESL